MMKRALAVILMITALVCVLPAAAMGEADAKIILSTPRNYLETKIFTENGEPVGTAYYDPFSDACLCPLPLIAAAADLEVKEELGNNFGSYKATGEGLTFKSVRGSDYVAANYRYFYTPGNYMIIGGAPCFDMEVLCRVFGFTMEQGESGDVIITSTGEGIIAKDKDYYINTYGKEDVKWLSHIIQAEAGAECLECKIAVGNVIFNRLDDPYFPNTIYKIVFQKDVDGTVQFMPAETGGINLPPTDESLIAAYMCFEGANTAGMSEFFVDPKEGDSSWFRNYLTYVVSLGKLDFYADPRRLDSNKNGA